ncbi:MAG: hypothetical protein ACREDO_01475 [Methyloceanibacter sp.]
MSRSPHLFAAALLGAAVLAQPAAAQDMTSATFSGTTIWVGGGVQFLSLPDIRFTGKVRPNGLTRQENSDSDWLDFGGAGGAGIETALGWLGNYRVSGSIKGFWANVEDDNRTKCTSTPGACVVIDPTGTFVGAGTRLVTNTDRDADYWGGQAELKFGGGEPVTLKPDLYRNDYFIIGADVRGIDQENKLHGKGVPFNYNETLDVTYTGGYIGLGGEYSFGFIPGLKNAGGLYDRLGLRTFVSARAGLYNAETDYRGRFGSGALGSQLNESNDELAFIGSISLETRKQVGPRTSLSLLTDYEYISSVPKMKYVDATSPTRIEDEAIFASRTMLRLNIGLGSQALYPEQ